MVLLDTMQRSERLACLAELFAGGHHEAVIAAAEEVLVHEPEDVELRLLLARSLLAQRRFEQARAELKGCAERDPGRAEPYRLLGELALRREDPWAAELFLEDALRCAPGDERAAELLDLARRLTGTPRPRFGDYLVSIGLLRPAQLAAALAYQQRTPVRLGSAAAALGFVAAQRLEWAALAYHASHARSRRVRLT